MSEGCPPDFMVRLGWAESGGAPDAPVELDHVSEVTPAVAVPLNAMVAVDVETMVIAGEVMVSDGGPAGGVVTGGVVTGGVVTGGVVTGGVEAWRVTAID